MGLVGNIKAMTQPLGATGGLKGAQAKSDLAALKSQIQGMDSGDLNALIQQAQATNPQLAQMIQHLVNNMPADQTNMSLGEIEGKGSSHRSHAQHQPQGGSHSLSADLKKLLDDIKKKQETASPSDNAAGAQGQSQQRPQDHYIQQHQSLSQLYPS